MKRVVILIFSLILSISIVNANEKQNIKELFKNNKAIIYTINIRNFGATDTNGNGLIDIDEQKGTFLNAKNGLKELKEEGINTIYLLPITKTGKLKALGTAGSLYALDDFETLNEQLYDENSNLTLLEQAKDFVNYAHKLNMYVIVDLPSCGSYDLSLKKPDWFLDKDLIPSDWTDVRLFKIYKNNKLNKTILQNHKKFIDMIISLGFDGIRADVAAIKPKEFWQEITNYTRSKKKNFLFLAEANPLWDNPAKNAINQYATIDELIEGGFDSYYGSWNNFKDIKSKKEFENNLSINFKILKKYKKQGTSIISALATHDQKAPILNGKNYWQTILWLSTTLPQNTYFLDGFKTGDDFIYPYENQKANYSLTDDNQYFVHTGQFDIFNLTAPTRIKKPELKEEYLKAINFKINNINLINKGKFNFLDTKNDKIIGYSIKNKEQELIVIASVDNSKKQNIAVKSNYLNKDYLLLNVNNKNNYKIIKDTLELTLEPHEIYVFMINLAKYRAM